MDLTPDKFSKPEGVYGQDVVAPAGVRLRAASPMESRKLAGRDDYIFFLPFLPLALCPHLPDPVAEYAQHANISLDLVYWPLDYHLVPKMASKDIRTDRVFGIPREHAWAFLNFAAGMLLEDRKTGLVSRLVIDRIRIIEPTQPSSSSAEKLMASLVDVRVFGVQTPTTLYRLQRAKNPKLLVVTREASGDAALWKVMNKFWTLDL